MDAHEDNLEWEALGVSPLDESTLPSPGSEAAPHYEITDPVLSQLLHDLEPHVASGGEARLELIRAKWLMDGATNLPEAAQLLRTEADRLDRLHGEGYVLQDTIDDDHGWMQSPTQ